METQTQNKMLEPIQPFDKNEILAEGKCEPKTFDVPLKKYRKKYVNEYVDALNKHYMEIIEANTNEIIKLGEAFVMVVGVINQAVVGKDDALGTAAGCADGVDVTFSPLAAFGVGQKAFVVAEIVAADGLAGSDLIQRAALPAIEVFGVLFGHIVGGQLAVQMDV